MRKYIFANERGLNCSSELDDFKASYQDIGMKMTVLLSPYSLKCAGLSRGPSQVFITSVKG